jgi:hypothetical protein
LLCKSIMYRWCITILSVYSSGYDQTISAWFAVRNNSV